LPQYLESIRDQGGRIARQRLQWRIGLGMTPQK
jgi:hypothetical protein